MPRKGGGEEQQASRRDSRDGRERLLAGARRLLAEKGYAGMELRDVAIRGKAPRGSIYHHFPGGKRQLAVEAAALEGREVRALIERSLEEHGTRGTLALFGALFSRRAAKHPELVGCPVAAAALRGEGVAEEDAATFAGLVVSTVEGALVRARAAGETTAIDSAVAGLQTALDALLARR